MNQESSTEKNEQRYIALRSYILDSGIAEGYYHGIKPNTEAEVDAAVDRLINFIELKKRQQ